MRTCKIQLSPSCLKEGEWRGHNCSRCMYWKRRDKMKLYNATRDWKKYREDNKERIRINNNKWQQKRHKENPQYRISKNLRHRIWLAIKTNPKHHKMNDVIGCSRDELIQHIECQWESTMTWDNYGIKEGCWSIDHKIPCASFDMTKAEDQAICFHYTNLQPMWHVDNIRKGCVE